jgi:hypothetical protein
MLNQICEALGTTASGCQCQIKLDMLITEGKCEDWQYATNKVPTIDNKYDGPTMIECPSLGECVFCYKDSIARELKDGDFTVICEFACFNTYHHEYGMEGDGDYQYKVVKQYKKIRKLWEVD